MFTLSDLGSSPLFLCWSLSLHHDTDSKHLALMDLTHSSFQRGKAAGACCERSFSLTLNLVNVVHSPRGERVLYKSSENMQHRGRNHTIRSNTECIYKTD